MNHSRLHELLQLAMADKLTQEERNEMLTLLRDPEHEAGAKIGLYEAFKEPKTLIDVDPQVGKDILAAVLQSGTVAQPEKKAVPLFGSFKWRIAAAVALVCLSIGFYFMKRHSDGPADPMIVQQKLDDVDPGSNKATLTLADGSVITLDEASKGKIAEQPGLVVTKNAAGQIIYEISEQEGQQDGFNTIHTPYGGHYEVVLQDGSKVVLNAGSSITYPLSFKGRARKVRLTGEAYFEVAKDPLRPFVISTPGTGRIQGQETTVLGTHFNINAYADEEAYVTTLLEGSVRVASTANVSGRILKPGQRAVLQQQIRIEEADLAAAVSWKEGYFNFMDESIEPVMRQLSRWYDVDVKYIGDVPTIGFWAQISRNKKLSEVLSYLEATNGVHFKIEGRRVTVMK